MFIRTTQQGVSDLQMKSLEKDWDSVAELAHKIIAPCRHIGADRLTVNLKKIEELARYGKDEVLLSGYIDEVKSDTATIISYIRDQMKKG